MWLATILIDRPILGHPIVKGASYERKPKTVKPVRARQIIKPIHPSLPEKQRSKSTMPTISIERFVSTML
jgi:hypothetical protein